MWRRISTTLFFLVLGVIAGVATDILFPMIMFGLAVGLYLHLVDKYLEKFHHRILLGGALGGVLGGSTGLLTAFTGLQMASYFVPVYHSFDPVLIFILIITVFAFIYLGLYLGVTIVKKADQKLQNQSVNETAISPKLLDTSVIIDGRITEIIEIGFLEGRFIVPKFIIREMQNMADSGDKLKRERGRRGLDILNKMRTELPVEIIISTIDFPNIPEVDSKLVAAAKEINAKIATNDFNLNKVARLDGIEVLNINELSNAVKPVFIPGETFKIKVIKQGEEKNQGVGYLDDGTMVVVENGKKYVGQTVHVTVTSVIQTNAGRMIFTEAGEIED